MERHTPQDLAAHVLIVDDDNRIRSLLAQYLGAQGYRVSEAENAYEARRKLEGLVFDLLVLDVMMPGETGFEFCHWLREERQDTTPVIMLTALGDVENRVEGLSAGADDFLAKPFDPRELQLRIQNILKRSPSVEVVKVEQIIFGPYCFNIARKQLRAGDNVLRLTEREQELLAFFAERADEVVPRDALTNAGETNTRSIDVQINRLRQKIELDPSNPIWLQTVRGVGYKLVTG